MLKQWQLIDCQAVKCSSEYGEGMQDGIKSEGWVLTDRASWRHNNGGVDTQKEQIKTYKHIKQEKGNKTNNKIRQNKIKVRMNDMLCRAKTFQPRVSMTERIQ